MFRPVSPRELRLCLAARMASLLLSKRSAWRMDLSLEVDHANMLEEEEHEEALLMLLGRCFGFASFPAGMNMTLAMQ